MPIPSTAIKSHEEAVGHAVDAANLQEEQLSPDAVVRFVGQHLMRCGTKAAAEEPTVVRKLRADVSQASADDLLDALARGEQQASRCVGCPVMARRGRRASRLPQHTRGHQST